MWKSGTVQEWVVTMGHTITSFLSLHLSLLFLYLSFPLFPPFTFLESSLLSEALWFYYFFKSKNKMSREKWYMPISVVRKRRKKGVEKRRVRIENTHIHTHTHNRTWSRAAFLFSFLAREWVAGQDRLQGEREGQWVDGVCVCCAIYRHFSPIHRSHNGNAAFFSFMLIHLNSYRK